MYLDEVLDHRAVVVEEVEEDLVRDHAIASLSEDLVCSSHLIRIEI